MRPSPAACLNRHPCLPLSIRSAKVRIEFFEDFLPSPIQLDSELLQDSPGDAIAFTQETEENAFGADVIMMKRFGLLGRKRQDFLYSRGVRDVAGHLLVGTRANHLFDLAPDSLEIQAHISEHVHGDALAEPDQAEQEMFCADEIVIEAVGFLARQSEGFLSAWREIFDTFDVRGRIEH